MFQIPMIDFPVIAMIGDRGDGKTLTMTVFADAYEKSGYNIFANYSLYGIEYQRVTFEELASFPDWLRDGVVLLDEGHIGIDAYHTFNKRVQAITKFITQTRKRRLIVIYTTQVFTTVARRMRNLTNYVLECNRTELNGLTRVEVHDRAQLKEIDRGHIKTMFIDGRPYFDNYDTNEIIALED